MDEIHYLEYEGRKIPYRIELADRYRRLSVIMGEDCNLVIRAPRRAGIAMIHGTARKNAAQFAEIYDRGRRSLSDPEAEGMRKTVTGEDGVERVLLGFECVDGASLPYGGRNISLHVMMQPGFKKPCITAKDGALYVELPAENEEQEQKLLESGIVPALVEVWYKKQAERVLPGLAAKEAEHMGVTFGRVTIRNQKTRWGSCSADGNLNFNVRIMLMPSYVVRYVVIHELCHRKHMDHSPEFWSMVETYDPDYREAVRFLNEKATYYRLR